MVATLLVVQALAALGAAVVMTFAAGHHHPGLDSQPGRQRVLLPWHYQGLLGCLMRRAAVRVLQQVSSAWAQVVGYDLHELLGGCYQPRLPTLLAVAPRACQSRCLT